MQGCWNVDSVEGKGLNRLNECYIASLTDDTVGTTLEHESDDVTVGRKDFGWVKTYAFLPEDRVGSRGQKTTAQEIKERTQ